MIAYLAADRPDIESMPRGGPDASCLDWRLQTDRLEYLDREDVDHLKRQVVGSLEVVGAIFGDHQRFARLALREIAEVPDPKILELGAGHGALSHALLEDHPTAEVTVTDVEPASVSAIAAGDLGSHPRATAPLHVMRLATMLPLAALVPFVHDGLISSLRAYSPSALRALAVHADPAIELTLRSGGFGLPPRARPQVVVARRRATGTARGHRVSPVR